MSNKVHFVCTQTELQDGPVKAVCGKVIEKPQKVLMWDEAEMQAQLPFFRTFGNRCRECFGMNEERRLPDGIVYGVREREGRRVGE